MSSASNSKQSSYCFFTSKALVWLTRNFRSICVFFTNRIINTSFSCLFFILITAHFSQSSLATTAIGLLKGCWFSSFLIARLTSKTDTRSSPRNPKTFVAVCALMIFSSLAGLIPVFLAIRGICSLALSGLISGSSPEPDVVTKSAGISFTETVGFSFRKSASSCWTRAFSLGLLGARFWEPEVITGLCPLATSSQE
ncbi:hypothetical protein STRPS_2023 [Streptococcus pseudoporcinus LQ 940-04]|uniref:Uncharacterized protein n=1 Tax=Streptococcus pseudoporcinus LQ 940-04 TaxID=875093 RepID=G5KAR1_9STRE|nr:hypothetical protein STRPS_2023 [Streptococcus pseudoporcinus LQ 940-04]